jgi:hypothetical protein
MAELTYNGVALSFLSTQSVLFEPIYDDLAGLDYECTRVVINCTAVLSSRYPPDAGGEGAVDIMRRISHLLNTPRRGLTFKVGGVSLVTIGAADTTIPVRDVRNGPNPKASVTRIMGTDSIAIAFQVEAYVVDCVGAETPQYVSHRWTETADVNDLALTRRNRIGRLVVRADLLANADQLRGLVVPPLEPDFLRMSSRYTLQADGRVLAYEFVDEEQYLMPPNPAAKAEGRFSITSKDGAAYWAECYLRLQGAKATDKGVLMLRAASIVLAKLQSANPAGGMGSFPMLGTFSEDMFANDVSIRMSAQVMPAKARMTTVSSSGSAGPTRPDGTAPGVSTPPNLDWLKIPSVLFDGTGGRFDPGSRGSAQLLLLSAALQDPCLRLAVLTNAAQDENTPSLTGTTTPATISIVATLPDDSVSYRASLEADGVYEQYDVSIRATMDEHTFSIPVGKKDADAAVIQTAGPTAHQRVEWRAIKVGGPPRVPSPILNDKNWTLTNQQMDPGQVEPIADGAVLRYIVAGCYDYVAKSAAKVKLAAAVPPWVDLTAVELANQPFLYASGILEPGSSSFSTGGGGTGSGDSGTTDIVTIPAGGSSTLSSGGNSLENG